MLKVAVAGAGKAGTILTEAFYLNPSAEVTRIVSRTKESAEKLALKFDVKNYGTDFNEIINDDNVDAVVIASPDKYHYSQAMSAFNAGKHVLCEKPMCRSVSEAEDMINASKKAGVILMVCFTERFNQPCLEAKSRIDRGEIGDPVMLLVRRCHPKFIVRGRKWLNDEETGGVLNYAGTHNIDLACWLMGSEPNRVYAEMGQLVLENQNFTDSVVLTLSFKNGAIASLYESFAYPSPYPHGVDRSIEVLGKMGCIKIDFMNQPLSVYSNEGMNIADSQTWPQVDGSIMGGAIVNEVNHFIKAVTKKEKVLTSGEDALIALKIAHAAMEAYLTGKAVYL
ncbi:MAG TPA: Gfo/Idh/MocA family oxidoreductase [Clostridiales bacterium]|nr:Gfo/Idh/MocA family oxidoreductase [Clostridiales bacterium]